jgi:hypothetical protein
VITNYNPLTYLKSQENLSRRQAWELEYLEQTFVYWWKYRPRRSNVADLLSKNPLDQRQVKLALLTRSASNSIKQSVKAHTVLGDPARLSKDGKSPPVFDNDLLNKIIARYTLNLLIKNKVNLEDLFFENSLWWYHIAIVVSKVDCLRNDILIECHDIVYSGHMGITKTLKQLVANFWWPKVRDDVKNYVNKCDICQRSKASTIRIARLLQPLELLDKKWDCVTIDFIIGLTPTKQGHDTILVYVDKLSKMAHFIATVTIVEETTRLFVDHVFKIHGLPHKLVRD